MIPHITGCKLNQLYSYGCGDAVGAERLIRRFQPTIRYSTQWGLARRSLKNLVSPPQRTTCDGVYTIDIGLESDTVESNVALAACLPEYGEVVPWPVDESKGPGSLVVMYYGQGG
jgi:hypothetical protein